MGNETASWLLIAAELTAARHWYWRELSKWLGGPGHECHLKADYYLDTLDWLDFVVDELVREGA